MKTLNIDIYHKYDDDIHHISINFPDNAIFTKLHWQEWGKLLVGHKRDGADINDYTDDDYCHEIYCYLPGYHDDQLYIDNDDLYIDSCINYLQDANGMLIKIEHSDIPDFDGFLSLDEFNSIADFSDAYYHYVKNAEMPENLLEEFTMQCNSQKYDFNSLADKIKSFEKYTIIAYCKIIRLETKGLYVKNVYVINWFNDTVCDNILHEIMDIDQFEFHEFSKTHMIYVGVSDKPSYEKRIREIVDI